MPKVVQEFLWLLFHSWNCWLGTLKLSVVQSWPKNYSVLCFWTDDSISGWCQLYFSFHKCLVSLSQGLTGLNLWHHQLDELSQQKDSTLIHPSWRRLSGPLEKCIGAYLEHRKFRVCNLVKVGGTLRVGPFSPPSWNAWSTQKLLYQQMLKNEYLDCITKNICYIPILRWVYM